MSRSKMLSRSEIVERVLQSFCNTCDEKVKRIPLRYHGNERLKIRLLVNIIRRRVPEVLQDLDEYIAENNVNIYYLFTMALKKILQDKLYYVRTVDDLCRMIGMREK